jgi:hypothetical protein
MLKFNSFFSLHDNLKPNLLFTPNLGYNKNNRYNNDLKKLINEGVQRTIENTKKRNESKYLNDYQIIVPAQRDNNSNSSYNYIFYILSFLAGYHFRYFSEYSKNT